MISKDCLKKSSAEIRKVTTIKIWVKKHGFSYGTVTQLLTGRGAKWQVGKSAEIIAALREDGFLEVL